MVEREHVAGETILSLMFDVKVSAGTGGKKK